jgi:isopenicillin-N N-acyltransferase like protein
MRAFELPPGKTRREQGRAHGEAFRGEVGSLAEIRLHLACKIGGGSRAQLLDLAERHLPVLERYDRLLSDELVGIAEGAALSPAMVLVLNHYTDLRDHRFEADTSAQVTDGCSAVWARTADGAVAGQTWDMHASSVPYVIMLHQPEQDGRPAAWMLSLTGCLGMAGLNRHGVVLCVNNLPATDARIGAAWPAVVRRALDQTSAVAARDALLAAPIGSGRHFLVADREQAFGVEVSGTRQAVVFSGERPTYVHTNHSLDPEIAARTQIAPGATTIDRFQFLDRRLEARPLAGPAELWQLLGSEEGYPRSVCSNQATPQDPHAPATCGGLVVPLGEGEPVVEACAGFTHNARPERFTP